MDFPPTLRNAGKRIAGTASNAYGAARGAIQGMRGGLPSVPEIPAGPIKAAGQKVASTVADGYKAAASYIPESVSTPVANAGQKVAAAATDAYQAARGLRMPGMTPSTPFPTLDMGLGGPELPAASAKSVSPLEGMIAKGQSALRSATIPGMTGRASTPFPTIDPALANVPPAPVAPPAAPVAPPVAAAPAAPRPVGAPATPVGPDTPGYVAPRDPRLTDMLKNGGNVPTLTQSIDPATGQVGSTVGPGTPGYVAPNDPRLARTASGLEPHVPLLNDQIDPLGRPVSTQPARVVGTYDAAAAGRPGPLAPLPAEPPTAVQGMRALAGDVNAGVRIAATDAAQGLKAGAASAIRNAPSTLGALGGAAAGAASFAPHWDAFGDDSTLDAGQKLKLMARDTSRAVGGVVGGVVGGAVGSSLAGPLGTLGGGIAGGAAGTELVEAAGGGLRRGLNWANEKLGGDANYITSTDEDLAADAARRAAKPAAAAPAAAAPAAAGTAPAAPAAQDDIAAFNARMGEIGATGVGMRAGATPDSRVLYGTAAGADKQAITDDRMAQRTSAVAAQDAQANAQQNERFGQLANNERMDALSRRTFDSSSYDADINAAKASGSVSRLNQAYGAREAAQRSFDTAKQTDAQTMSSMRGYDVAARGQDVTERDAIRSNQTAMANGMRQAAIAQRSYNLDERKFGAEQDKTAVAQREEAQKSLADSLGTMFTTQGPDGKTIPDAARVGDAVQKIHAEVGARIADLQKVPKDADNYARAQQLARELSTKGLAALDADDRATLMSQLAIRDRVKQTAGQLPGKAKFVDSRLGGYAATGIDPALIGSDRIKLGNGGYVRANDLRYNEPANALLPDVFKQGTDQFDAGLGLRGKTK